MFFATFFASKEVPKTFKFSKRRCRRPPTNLQHFDETFDFTIIATIFGTEGLANCHLPTPPLFYYRFVFSAVASCAPLCCGNLKIFTQELVHPSLFLPNLAGCSPAEVQIRGEVEWPRCKTHKQQFHKVQVCLFRQCHFLVPAEVHKT